MALPQSAARPPNGLLERLLGSAVVWSWVFNVLRLASGVLLLPLLLRVLSKPDQGIYYVFLDLAMVVPMMDFGFALSVERSLAYARGGATSLVAIGVGAADASGQPNEALMQEVVGAARLLYRWLAAGAFVLLAVVGTVMIGLRVHETSSVQWTWLAWGVHLVALSFEIYTGFWVAVLRGMNRVTSSVRWLSLQYGLKLALAVVLLRLGAGLLAVPIAALVAGVILRAGAGREVRRLLGGGRWGEAATDAVRKLLVVLWPNSWRLGVQLVAYFLGTNAYAFICVKHFGLAAKAEYGLSAQVMNIAVGIAGVWTSVKWPLVTQLRLRGERAAMWAVLRPRFLLQVGTYVALVLGAVLVGPWLLVAIGSKTQMLPTALLALLALNSLGEINFAFWTTLISTENRIPALWVLLATHIAGVITVSLLVFAGNWGLEAFVVVPLVLGGLFNYWWWAREGTRMLGATFPRFLLQSPTHGTLRTSPPS